MRFNKVYQNLIEALDPEVEAVWGDIIPGISEPVTYYCYTVIIDRGRYDVWHGFNVKARSIEEAQDKVVEQAEEDWKESWAENAESANRDSDDEEDEYIDPDDAPENEFIQKFPVDYDDIAVVGTGEETVVLITTKKLTNKQIETYLETALGDL